MLIQNKKLMPKQAVTKSSATTHNDRLQLEVYDGYSRRRMTAELSGNLVTAFAAPSPSRDLHVWNSECPQTHSE